MKCKNCGFINMGAETIDLDDLEFPEDRVDCEYCGHDLKEQIKEAQDANKNL